jgi:hypothetical protein
MVWDIENLVAPFMQVADWVTRCFAPLIRVIVDPAIYRCFIGLSHLHGHGFGRHLHRVLRKVRVDDCIVRRSRSLLIFFDSLPSGQGLRDGRSHGMLHHNCLTSPFLSHGVGSGLSSCGFSVILDMSFGTFAVVWDRWSGSYSCCASPDLDYDCESDLLRKWLGLVMQRQDISIWR